VWIKNELACHPCIALRFNVRVIEWKKFVGPTSQRNQFFFWRERRLHWGMQWPDCQRIFRTESDLRGMLRTSQPAWSLHTVQVKLINIIETVCLPPPEYCRNHSLFFTFYYKNILLNLLLDKAVVVTKNITYSKRFFLTLLPYFITFIIIWMGPFRFITWKQS